MKIYSSTYQNAHIGNVGGKAYNLLRLKRLGLKVPEFVIIDQEVLNNFLPLDLKTEYNISKIHDAIDEYHFDDTLELEIRKMIPDPENKLFSVRSSAVQEDGKQFSFAGQFESYLYVPFEDLSEFIKRVWKSNFSERVKVYMENNQIEPSFGIGVVIQEMIDPEVSGVGFGINPNTGEQGTKVLCAVYGVGEGLVSGALNADTYTISTNGHEAILVQKTQAARRSGSGEIKYEQVEENKQKLATLSDQQIQELCAILESLEFEIGSPQDIEFAIKENDIYVLQTRPITAISKSPAEKKYSKNRIIWDNSNIIESYPGVTTPLTFTYILEAYNNVYSQLAMIMGVSKKTISKHQDTFSNMLGLINGRVYYNLFSWYRMLSLFPGYKLNKRFMENMMGVKEKFDLPKKKSGTKLGALARTILMIIRIIGHLFTIKKQTRRFMKDMDLSVQRIKQMDLTQKTSWELKQIWIEMDEYLTPRWKAPVLNDSFAMYYFGKLHKLIEKYNFTDNKNLQNDLLCGSNDIISVEPVHRSLSLATHIAENPKLKTLFVNCNAGEIWNTLHQPGFESILEQINDYLDVFGERCVGELKLETVSYKQDPTQFIAMLKSFVKQGVTNSSTESNLDKQLRIAAELEIRKGLSGKPLRRRKLNSILKKTRYFVSNRENLRYERTRAFGITRSIFVQIGHEFVKAGNLENHRDIFYLTKDEIFAFIEGTSVDTDLKALTTMRKAEYAEYEKMEVPAERFTTYDAVNADNNFFDTSIVEAPSGNLSGIGCCPGVVRARVQVVNHPGEIESLSGDILVTSSTDPGWVTLFPTTSGILVERGSLLSHSAIVSREMGIPCIVGVTGLLKTLKTGDMLEMDGSTGTIKILQNE